MSCASSFRPDSGRDLWARFSHCFISNDVWILGDIVGVAFYDLDSLSYWDSKGELRFIYCVKPLQYSQYSYVRQVQAQQSQVNRPANVPP